MIAHTLNVAKIMNVKIHVLISFAVLELSARQKLIELFANVLQAYRATHWLLVLKPDVLLILNVPEMKSVIISLLHLQEKNANLYVEIILVQLGLRVLQATIEKFVLVIILFKEMDMFLVLKSEYQMSPNAGLTKIVNRNWLALISLARTHVE